MIIMKMNLMSMKIDMYRLIHMCSLCYSFSFSIYPLVLMLCSGKLNETKFEQHVV